MKLPNLPSSTILSWSKLVAITGFTQVAIQGLAFVCGIIIIRFLTTQDYAVYTIANAALGMLLVLANGGVSSGVMSEGGKCWRNRSELGSVMVTGLKIRKRFAIASLLIVLPILVGLLVKNKVDWLTIVFVVLAILPAFYASVTSSIYLIASKLSQRISKIQLIQVGSSAGRLLLTASFLLLKPWVPLAILAAGVAQIFANKRLKLAAQEVADLNADPKPEYRAAILRAVSRLMPGSVYFAFSGQIAIWMISLYGDTSSIAEVGALGRLSMLMGLFTSCVGLLLIPRFARAPARRSVLLKHSIVLSAAAIIFALGVLGTVLTFPNYVLWILGDGYADLSGELLISLSTASILLLSGTFQSANIARGWLLSAFITLPFYISNQIFWIWFSDLTTTSGVLKMNLGIAFGPLLLNTGNHLFHLFKTNEAKI